MMKKKLLALALTGLMAGGSLLMPAMAETAAQPSGQTTAEYALPADTKRIDEYAFAGNTSLVSVKIPDGVTAIGDYAFAGCTSLQDVILPVGLTEIGAHAFDPAR